MSDDDEPLILLSDRQDVPVDGEALAALAAEVLSAEGSPRVELSVSFVTPEEMSDLHQRYLGESGPTDVLSFPMDDDGDERRLLGDVVVCPAVAASQTDDLASELRLLLVHGILHLLGHDHDDDAERDAMWAKQERYSGVRVPSEGKR